MQHIQIGGSIKFQHLVASSDSHFNKTQVQYLLNTNSLFFKIFFWYGFLEGTVNYILLKQSIEHFCYSQQPVKLGATKEHLELCIQANPLVLRVTGKSSKEVVATARDYETSLDLHILYADASYRTSVLQLKSHSNKKSN